MSFWDDAKGAISTVYEDVSGSLFEDNEAAPSGYQQAVAQETSAAGNAATTTPSAQTNTGETITYATNSTVSPYIVVGGAVVLGVVVALLLIRGGK